MDCILESFVNGDLTVNYSCCRTTTGSLMYGGKVYYKGEFIKFLPFTDRKELTRKYMLFIAEKHVINELGIFLPCKDGDLIVYSYFNKNMIYPTYC